MAIMSPTRPNLMAAQHPMHAMVAPLSPGVDPMEAYEAGMAANEAPADVTQGTQVGGENQPGRVMSMSPVDPYEESLKRRQMADFAKDENPYGSPDNHPGFFGKLLHGLNVATGGVNRRKFEEEDLGNKIQDVEGKKTDDQLKQSQAENLNLQPQLKLAQQQLAHEKQDETETHHQQQIQQQLHTHGYKQDDSGNIVPLQYEEMSPQQQAVTDLKNSQQNLADATEEVRRASIDPNSPAYKLSLQKLEIAKQGHDAAQTRATAQLMNAYGGNYGTDLKGNALPGAMLDANGGPVGSHFSGNVRPTGQERNKSDMAASADQQIGDIEKIVRSRPDIFGPIAGRTTDFNVWVGSQDPDAQRFRAARTIAGDHLAGTFGGRSEAALNALDSAIGHFKDNPQAIEAGLGQLKEANHLFLQRGTVHTVGGNNSESNKGTIFARDDKGILHQAPAGTPLPKGWKKEER